MMRDLMAVLWQAVKPHTELVSGMYLALLMLGALWAVGAILGWSTPKLIAWQERRRGTAALPVLTEVRVILLTLAVVCVMMISIILVSDALLGQEWTLFPLPIPPD
jgi:hypothetical protein